MSTDSIANLPAALDVAVLERTPRGLFRPAGSLPQWMIALSGEASEIDLAERFPFLELFFCDCASLFATGIPARLESDAWEERDAAGATLYLQAVAMRLDGRNLVALKTLPRERFTYQQLFHEFQLAKEEAQRQKLVAERATRAKSDFLAAMSHEIRTPLNAIIGMADVLASGSLNQDQRKCVEILQRNGSGLLNLINDILDLSKVEAGKVELEAIRMNLREVVSRAAEVVDGRARAKGLGVEVRISPAIPAYFRGDANRLRQILINLLGNSIKFTEQGRLEVRVGPDPEDPRPGSLLFAVSDTGIGIPEDKRSLIFESFSQADGSTTRKYGGTGLGLSISRQLVELMGGRIWVKSKVGEGSTFFFTAKLGVDDDQSEPAPETASLAAAGLERQVDGLRILLADDSSDNRFLILSYLKEAYCSIEVAENGQEAWDKFRGGRFDVVLMDVEMPTMDGFTATREIRRYEHEAGLPATPVVALTAHAFADIQDRCRQAGFTAYLTKPLRKATLIEALASGARLARAIETESQQAGEPPAGPEQYGPGAPRVLVHKGMEDVVPAYLARRRKDVETYREALDRGDFDAVRALGHKMSGTGGGYGFPLLTELGRAIEQAALRRDAAALGASVDLLASYVENVQLDYAEGTRKQESAK